MGDRAMIPVPPDQDESRIPDQDESRVSPIVYTVALMCSVTKDGAGYREHGEPYAEGKACTADFGAKKGDPVCCGQAGAMGRAVVNEEDICGLSLEERTRLYGGMVKDMPSYTAALKNDDPSRPIMYFEVEIQNSCLTTAALALEQEGAPNFIGQ